MRNLKKILIVTVLSVLVFFNAKSQNQNVSINDNGASPDQSAILDISSTTKGLLIPRMTTSQRTTITPLGMSEKGLFVYDTDLNQFWYWDGAHWVPSIGLTGPTGPAGVNGAVGPTGPAGVDGVPGITGSTGADGIQGIPGIVGPTGADGIQGIPGIIGPTGADGIQGIPGIIGPTGADGIQGVPGIIGPTGADGIQGIPGITGSTGIQGLIGPTGPDGCSTLNYLLKGNGTSTTCTQAPIYETAGGLVGIGTITPGAKLDVEGNVKIADGTQGAGRILTSDAAGLTSWQTPASIPMYGNNAHSIKLAALVKNNTTGSYSDITGMSITMTTVHNTFYVFSSFTARLDDGTGTAAQFGQAIIEAQLVVDGTAVSWAGATVTDYDATNGIVTTGTVAFAGIPVTLAPGSHTIKLQWQPVFLWADNPHYIVINPTAGAADHCILTIFD